MKFVINMVEKQYSKFEVEADNIEEARDILETYSRGSVDILRRAMGSNSRIAERKPDYEQEVVTEYYDINWNDL